MIDTIKIGTKVFWFDPSIQHELEIKEGIVLGSFVHKQDGELNYFVDHETVPAYSVAETREGIEELLAAFNEYREKLLEANAENKIRFEKLREGKVFPEYSINND